MIGSFNDVGWDAGIVIFMFFVVGDDICLIKIIFIFVFGGEIEFIEYNFIFCDVIDILI